MQLLLVALGGCSGIDVVMILNKGRQTIDTMSISIDGVRPGDTGPSPYQRIHARYELTGDLDPDKVVRAVRLSIDKYCSVAKTLALGSEITYTCIVNGNEHG